MEELKEAIAKENKLREMWKHVAENLPANALSYQACERLMKNYKHAWTGSTTIIEKTSIESILRRLDDRESKTLWGSLYKDSARDSKPTSGHREIGLPDTMSIKWSKIRNQLTTKRNLTHLRRCSVNNRAHFASKAGFLAELAGLPVMEPLGIRATAGVTHLIV